MGRRSHSRALGVWMNGALVGHWRIPASGPMEFAYDLAWVEDEAARPLSLSLPMNLDGVPLKGERVGFFFDNLLPDSEVIRRRLQSRFRLPKADAFDLLAAIGRDCVGAVQLLPGGTTPSRLFEIDVTPLADEKVESMLVGAVSEPALSVGEDDDFRISIAGAQEKTAFTWHEGRWCKPHGTTPTTHIFKLPLGLVGGMKLDLRTSLENEWLCARIFQEFGIPIASCELERFGVTKALVVTRFDRKLHSSGKYWLRLPQEDFCQATGTPSHLRYEADGGPGLSTIARILQGSESREDDLGTLMKAQLLFWMLAAIDGHAKDFSVRLLPRGRFHLTPLYDVISAWPITGARHDQIHPKKLKLAMALLGANKHYRVAEIERRHFATTAKRCGLGGDMDAIIDEVVERAPSVIDAVGTGLPEGFPGKVFESITKGLAGAAKEMAAAATR
ncbi:MAG: type II toxin-antitoxin system HipA family toxin [Polyangiaceae bacterium]|nr:type II toxin-antitoxin system HipA family toxin [Polyangiaceae bacterium]